MELYTCIIIIIMYHKHEAIVTFAMARAAYKMLCYETAIKKEKDGETKDREREERVGRKKIQPCNHNNVCLSNMNFGRRVASCE